MEDHLCLHRGACILELWCVNGITQVCFDQWKKYVYIVELHGFNSLMSLDTINISNRYLN